MLPASLFATVKEVPQVSGFDRTLDLPCSRHSAYEAMARLIVQYLGSEERIPAELLEMLRNGDLYKVRNFGPIDVCEWRPTSPHH